jgi:hypothetical protein
MTIRTTGGKHSCISHMFDLGNTQKTFIAKTQRVCINGTSQMQQQVGSDASRKYESRPESDVGRNSHKPGRSQDGVINDRKGIGKCMVVTNTPQMWTWNMDTHITNTNVYVLLVSPQCSQRDVDTHVDMILIKMHPHWQRCSGTYCLDVS